MQNILQRITKEKNIRINKTGKMIRRIRNERQINNANDFRWIWYK